ncbi:MAG: hypothetical protein Q7S88_03620 [Candidatus Daviesbacteria bacterium]|nr:hypothetical protein [Candidatus Daviesbacteria bacterium]
MAKVDLSPEQRRLAETLYTTTTQGKVNRRFQNPDQTYRFESITRPVELMDFPKHPGEFALKLHEKRPDAPLSPFFLNFRNLSDEVLKVTAEAMASLPISRRPDMCTGIPNAGEPIAKAYSKVTDIPYVDIFDKIDLSNGTRLIIPKNPGTRIRGQILITDDLVTGADTKFEAITAAEILGLKVVGIAVAIDREQGGAQQLIDAGYPFYAALKVTELLKYGVQTNRLSEDSYQNILQYLGKSK